jgi:hemerythrin
MYTEWTPDLSVGIGEIDVQHRKMVRKINEIAEAIDAARSKDEIIEAIRYFEVYSEEHFKTEEGFMAVYHYPDLPEHRLLHEKILKDMSEVRIKFGEGKIEAEEVYKSSRQVAEWFTIHMKTTDSKMAVFLRGKVK